MAYLGTFQRRVETVLIEFQRSRTYWKELNDEGFTTASRLVNTHIQALYADDLGYWHPVLRQAFPNLMPRYEAKMAARVQQELGKLQGTVGRMDKQYTKMRTFYRELRAIEKRAHDLAHDPNMPLFKTCPIHVFGDRVQQLVQMYESELASKRLLVQGALTSVKSQQEGMALLSVWLNQSQLHDDAIAEFQAICDAELT
ncbi:hypothetical protein BC940DRAFT_319701 [Gongronella butleri]|nr:hypothetical protein BC940DRAFT_319701 [Gongronella butleri]